MTYKELQTLLSELSDEQLNMTATVYFADADEYWAIDSPAISGEDNDVLDADHPYLVVGE
jgi:hypothetical protein